MKACTKGGSVRQPVLNRCSSDLNGLHGLVRVGGVLVFDC